VLAYLTGIGGVFLSANLGLSTVDTTITTESRLVQ